MNKNVMDLISDEKIYPIVRSKDAQSAIDIANALIEGGIKVMEIVIENPSLFSAIDEISKEAVVCAGGIITQQQAEQAINSGAKLFSSPLSQMNIIKISKCLEQRHNGSIIDGDLFKFNEKDYIITIGNDNKIIILY